MHDPMSRLGSLDFSLLKMHPVFQKVDFDELYESQSAPLKPRQKKLSLQQKQELAFLPARRTHQTETTLGLEDQSATTADSFFNESFCGDHKSPAGHRETGSFESDLTSTSLLPFEIRADYFGSC
jgi:hypothetical protein